MNIISRKSCGSMSTSELRRNSLKQDKHLYHKVVCKQEIKLNDLRLKYLLASWFITWDSLGQSRFSRERRHFYGVKLKMKRFGVHSYETVWPPMDPEDIVFPDMGAIVPV